MSYSSAKTKANVPTLEPRFLVKFPSVGKAIEVKFPTYARGPRPLRLNINRWINPAKVVSVDCITSYHCQTRGKLLNNDASLILSRTLNGATT